MHSLEVPSASLHHSSLFANSIPIYCVIPSKANSVHRSGPSPIRGSGSMNFFKDQLKQVLRRLLRAPLFTSIILITLSIGIGANAVVFGVVDGVLLKPLSYPHPEQLIGIWHSATGIGFDELNMAPFLYFIDREQSSTLQSVGMYNGDSLSITGVGQPEH